jgi:hypothetical protein
LPIAPAHSPERLPFFLKHPERKNPTHVGEGLQITGRAGVDPRYNKNTPLNSLSATSLADTLTTRKSAL